MSKNVFAVVLLDGEDKGAKLLQKAHPKAFPLADNVFLVADDGLTATVADAASLTKEKANEGIRGVVFRLNGTYTGYAKQSLWEWLADAEGVE